jgi:hypothetical protein
MIRSDQKDTIVVDTFGVTGKMCFLRLTSFILAEDVATY